MSTDAVPVGTTVMIVKPIGPFEIGDAVVMDVQPYMHPLEGGGLLPSRLYLLQFADGGAHWYERHKFDPIGVGQ